MLPVHQQFHIKNCTQKLGPHQLHGKSTYPAKTSKSYKKVFIPKCYECSAVGHFPSKCPKNNNKQKQANLIDCNHITDHVGGGVNDIP
eukprot:13589715-Ditylum_brightwellii.AAC.1